MILKVRNLLFIEKGEFLSDCFKIFVAVLALGTAHGTIFNTNPLRVFPFRGLARGFVTVRPVTTLNTAAIPRNLIPPAPVRPIRLVPRVYATSTIPQIYSAPKILKPITALPQAITTIPTFTNSPRNGATNTNTNTNTNNQSYSYSYGVNDPLTGDVKQAEERSTNGVVRGSYSLTEPDGSIRRVTYTADNINGFNAVVERVPRNNRTPTFFRQ